MRISETLLPEFDEEMKSTRKILAIVPDDKLDYKPHDKSMTLGRLASHVAEMPAWVEKTMEVEVFEISPDQKGYLAASNAELLATFDRTRAEARTKLAAASDEDFLKTWTLKFGDREIFSMPRNRVLRIMVMNHMIHHRGQLGVFLRLLDVEIPGMYGPSADEMKWWNA